MKTITFYVKFDIIVSLDIFLPAPEDLMVNLKENKEVRRCTASTFSSKGKHEKKKLNINNLKLHRS